MTTATHCMRVALTEWEGRVLPARDTVRTRIAAAAATNADIPVLYDHCKRGPRDAS